MIIKGFNVLVDEQDEQLIARHKWQIRNGRNDVFYAQTQIQGKTVYMHRLITGAQSGQVVDHINRNGLDNRKSNLRLVSISENARNSIAKGGRSKFKGVSLHSSGLWRAEIELPQRKRKIRYAKTEEEAARLYDELASEYFGACARLNEYRAAA